MYAISLYKNDGKLEIGVVDVKHGISIKNGCVVSDLHKQLFG